MERCWYGPTAALLTRPLRIALAVGGSLAFQGSVIEWVADHRRHHAFADKDGDPHSPWLFGTTPALLGGLISWYWWGAVTALFWADLVRVAVLHHVTFSVNSICHMIGARPFTARDRSANFWPLAILSFGEFWHNLHHADPTCARHGVLRGQVDISARLIWCFQCLAWVHQVRWPTPQRLARITRARCGEDASA